MTLPPKPAVILYVMLRYARNCFYRIMAAACATLSCCCVIQLSDTAVPALFASHHIVFTGGVVVLCRLSFATSLPRPLHADCTKWGILISKYQQNEFWNQIPVCVSVIKFEQVKKGFNFGIHIYLCFYK